MEDGIEHVTMENKPLVAAAEQQQNNYDHIMKLCKHNEKCIKGVDLFENKINSWQSMVEENNNKIMYYLGCSPQYKHHCGFMKEYWTKKMQGNFLWDFIQYGKKGK